ncbi:hypothetical protein ColKHC_02409 [Colletotrichum higginsianum]|nr:hypothetical protein ColKHC_02409 [Colletotrichum higginsianum]
MSAEPNTKFAPEPKIQNKGRELSFKQKLDQAAHDARKPDEESRPNPIIEKAATKILGNPQKEQEERVTRPGIPGPPERPYDDTQVEEFIRQQHRSKGEDGLLE